MFLAMTLSIVGLVCTANAIDEKKLVDMTYAFASDTLHWPTAKPFQLEKSPKVERPRGFGIRLTTIAAQSMSEPTSMLLFILPKADGQRSKFRSEKRLDRGLSSM